MPVEVALAERPLEVHTRMLERVERAVHARERQLLVAYSAGLALPFLLAGVAFARAMGAFRWLRDRYAVIQAVSGAILVALGLLLFFDRFWWIQAGLKRALDALGLHL